MLEFKLGINLIGFDGCAPCAELKRLLRGHALEVNYIDYRTLSESDVTLVRSKVGTVTTAGKFSLPAVVVVQDGIETWFSNNDKEDVADMFKKIRDLVDA